VAASSTSRHPRRAADEKLRRVFGREGRRGRPHQSLARELGPLVRVNAVAPAHHVAEDDPNFDEVSRQRIVSHPSSRPLAAQMTLHVQCAFLPSMRLT